jgi:predicted GNAT family acetyltransferase
MAEVQHLSNNQQFIIRQDEGDAVLAYRLSVVDGQSAVDFYSTYVPPGLRGKGLAEKLVRTGLAWAREQGLQIQASCWYVATFIR